MLITSYYNFDTKIEKAWYNSSNVFYSEFVEDSEKNEGDLYVTFNNGATYKYKKVKDFLKIVSKHNHKQS